MMENNSKYLIFLPCCMFVKGYYRSVILDIQRGVLDFIPNELYEIYQKYNKQNIDFILSHYSIEEQDIINEYVGFLIKNEYAILGTQHDANNMTDLQINYNYWGHITNCVCEYSDFIKENIKIILDKTDKLLNCSAFQLFCSQTISIDNLTDLLKAFDDLIFHTHIEIILPYSSEYNEKSLNKLLMKQCLLNRIILYNSPIEKVDDRLYTIIIHTKQNLNRFRCGIVAKEYFTQNIFHVTEAINHNTCLHKKLSIDKEGNIKNCPFSGESFGNILNDNILNIIKSKSYTKYWNINKDKIEVCKDCEFRYVCTDCRVFVKDQDNIFSQPLYCTYNPYIAKWKGEENYVSVEESLKGLSVIQ